MAANDENNNDQNNKDEDGYEVLKIFGMKLKVKDPKIADLLTTDVTEDMSTFSSKMKGDKAENINEETIQTSEEIGSQESLQEAISEIGSKLGFDVGLGGIWRSTTGMAIIIKPLFELPDFDSARRAVASLAQQQKQIRTENTGLFVANDRAGCDIVKAAIRSNDLYHLMRVVSYENLCELVELKEGGYLNHRQVVTLMVPLDNVDVGELLNIVKNVAMPSSLEEYLSRKQT